MMHEPTKIEPTKNEPIIEIKNVSKYFDDVTAVDQVSLTIHQGEFFSLLGGSGSGKTTLLRMLAGFELPDQGKIIIDGVDMTTMEPFHRPINMMFQSYALFPHMSVAANVAFGLKQEKLSKIEIKQRTDAALEMVQMADLGKRKPHQLSGGQRQRVALARCLAKRPKVVLLDEPLSALDKKLREQMQFELVDIQEKLGITFVMVTHDQAEAMTMSTRIAVMNNGWLEQIGTPSEIYEFPVNRFAANFIGSTNMFEAKVLENEADNVRLRSSEARCDFHIDHAIQASEKQTLWLAIRPEKMFIELEMPKDYDEKHPVNYLKGKVEDIAYLGGLSTYHVRLPSKKLVKATDFNIERKSNHPTWGDEVYLSWEPQNLMVLTS